MAPKGPLRSYHRAPSIKADGEKWGRGRDGDCAPPPAQIRTCGGYPLNKISGFDIERYKYQRQKEPLSVRPRGKTIVRAADKTTAKPSAINRELAVLSNSPGTTSASSTTRPSCMRWWS